MKTYRAVKLMRAGGPEALEVVELPVREPGPGELRVRVVAAGVGATDLTILRGDYPYAPPPPLVPGYEVAGAVEAIGEGVQGWRVGQRAAALTVYGGFAETIVREASLFVPIPDAVSDVDAAAAILNHVSAWQMIHRVARVRSGDTVLVTGAGGGVGTALLQQLRLLGASVFGAASKGRHDAIRALGAQPLDRHAGCVGRLVRERVPAGVDHVFDAVGYSNVGPCITALRRRGRLVGYGFMGGSGLPSTLAMFLHLFVGATLRGRRASFYGITMRYRRDPRPFHEDLPRVFELLAQRRIDPLVQRTYPLLEAARALEHLAAGGVTGKLVLRSD